MKKKIQKKLVELLLSSPSIGRNMPHEFVIYTACDIFISGINLRTYVRASNLEIQLQRSSHDVPLPIRVLTNSQIYTKPDFKKLRKALEDEFWDGVESFVNGTN